MRMYTFRLHLCMLGIVEINPHWATCDCMTAAGVSGIEASSKECVGTPSLTSFISSWFVVGVIWWMNDGWISGYGNVSMSQEFSGEAYHTYNLQKNASTLSLLVSRALLWLFYLFIVVCLVRKAMFHNIRITTIIISTWLSTLLSKSWLTLDHPQCENWVQHVKYSLVWVSSWFGVH